MAKRTNGGSSPRKEVLYKAHYHKRSTKVKERLEKIVEKLKVGKHKGHKYEIRVSTVAARADVVIKHQIIRVK